MSYYPVYMWLMSFFHPAKNKIMMKTLAKWTLYSTHLGNFDFKFKQCKGQIMFLQPHAKRQQQR